MKAGFFDAFDASEKRRIKDRTDALASLLEEWAQEYTVVRTVRIPVAALTTAAVLPHLPPSESVLSSQMMLWVAGVDDEIDETDISLADIQCKARRWCSIAGYSLRDGANGSDQLAAMLVDIAERLSGFETFEPLREYWASCLRLLLEAMIQEYHYRQRYNAGGVSTLPTLDEYLRNGMYSVGMHLWQSTALILLRDFSVLNHLDSIHEVVNQASKAIRLYNDLQTFDKEIQEGGVNSVLVVYHMIHDSDPDTTGRRTLSEAQRHTLQLADSYARKCYDLAAQIQTESRQFEEAIRRLVAFGAFFYRKHDYHTTPMTKVNEFLDPSKDRRETMPGRCKGHQVASIDIKKTQRDQQVGGNET